tara:strand:- start:86 stop:424 length:339 start_codon:yes stop_codon:yes gene_type:complete
MKRQDLFKQHSILDIYRSGTLVSALYKIRPSNIFPSSYLRCTKLDGTLKEGWSNLARAYKGLLVVSVLLLQLLSSIAIDIATAFAFAFHCQFLLLLPMQNAGTEQCGSASLD